MSVALVPIRSEGEAGAAATRNAAEREHAEIAAGGAGLRRRGAVQTILRFVAAALPRSVTTS